jgi:hypothetical protein
MTFDCKANLKPMKDWIQEEDPKKDHPTYCRPCMLAPVVQWYRDTLKEQGKPEMAIDLEKTVNQSDGTADEIALTICEKLDTIKESVEDTLRERLKDFDCAAQAFNPDDATEDQATAEPKS